LAFLAQERIGLKVLNEKRPRFFTGRRLRGTTRSTDRLILLFVLLLCGIVSPVSRAWGQLSGTTGYAVKIAFLFNFAKFIDWPPSSFAGPQSPFTICVLGQDPFGHMLDDTLQGKMIGERPLAVRRLRDKTEARYCHIVFVSSLESAHLSEIIGSLQGANVLLVGETNGFAALGGAIEFTLEDNHVRFAINADAADRSGLKFSSKLLALAKIVHDEGHSKGG
jgi:YfiR/HmsC-like